MGLSGAVQVTWMALARSVHLDGQLLTMSGAAHENQHSNLDYGCSNWFNMIGQQQYCKSHRIPIILITIPVIYCSEHVVVALYCQ